MTSEIECFHRYWNSASQTPRYPLKWASLDYDYCRTLLHFPDIIQAVGNSSQTKQACIISHNTGWWIPPTSNVSTSKKMVSSCARLMVTVPVRISLKKQKVSKEMQSKLGKCTHSEKKCQNSTFEIVTTRIKTYILHNLQCVCVFLTKMIIKEKKHPSEKRVLFVAIASQGYCFGTLFFWVEILSTLSHHPNNKHRALPSVSLLLTS